MQVFANFIDGEWSSSGERAPDINPSDRSDVVGEGVLGTRQDVDAAVAAAKRAFPAWSRSTPQQRYDVLKAASDELLSRKEALGELLSREEGKILPEGIGEAARAGQIFAFFAGECLRLAGEKVASVRAGVDIEVTREAVGVIGVITPWNYPLAIPAWKIAAALAYGNTIVFKPAELVPASACGLVDVIERAGLPKGVLNLVMGTGAVVGTAILEHADVSAVSFTGSVATGRKVAQACIASHPMKKVQLEMGGKNPLVVLDDAELDLAVDCALNSAFFSTGQRCTAASRLIVTDGIHDRFLAALTARLQALKVGHALAKGTEIGPVVDRRQLDQNLRYLDIAAAEGAHLASGGKVLQREHDGFYMAPALLTGVTNQMRVAREEIFGPIAALIRVKDYDEALSVANDTEFGLASGVCTTSLRHASHFRRNAEAGIVMVNLPIAGVDYHVPFGGRKASSYGSREQGRYAAEFYTTVKTAYLKP